MRRKTIEIKNSVERILREKAGETIVETLVSMLIVVLAFMMLAGAIVAAARVNAGTENHTMYLNLADTSGTNEEISGADIRVTAPTDAWSAGKTVKTYKMKDSSGILYYYE